MSESFSHLPYPRYNFLPDMPTSSLGILAILWLRRQGIVGGVVKGGTLLSL